MITVEVGGPYPCWVTLRDENGDGMRIRHSELLQWESAMAEAKRQVLCKLDRNDWHEIDPTLAGK